MFGKKHRERAEHLEEEFRKANLILQEQAAQLARAQAQAEERLARIHELERQLEDMRTERRRDREHAEANLSKLSDQLRTKTSMRKRFEDDVQAFQARLDQWYGDGFTNDELRAMHPTPEPTTEASE